MTNGLKRNAAIARHWLFEQALPLWWERGFDRASGCFHEQLLADGTPDGSPRRVRVQARQTSVYALAGQLGWQGPWRDAAEAGVDVLLHKAIRADGGTRHLLGADGSPLDERRDLYDLAFVVFALAEAARALRTPELVVEAKKLLAWINANWSHPSGGYEQGEVTPARPRRQNPHMHLFEALLALHEATGEREYLEEAAQFAQLLESKLYNHTYKLLPEYFADDWSPMKGPLGAVVEPGHDFEWSWLLHRYTVLGGGDFSKLSANLLRHSEIRCVDAETGVVWDQVFTDDRPPIRTSRLWTNTERLKAHLVHFERTGDSAAEKAANEAFALIMRYCDVPLRGLWRDKLLANGAFADGPTPASILYHLIYAMAELIRVGEAAE